MQFKQKQDGTRSWPELERTNEGAPLPCPCPCTHLLSPSLSLGHPSLLSPHQNPKPQPSPTLPTPPNGDALAETLHAPSEPQLLSWGLVCLSRLLVHPANEPVTWHRFTRCLKGGSCDRATNELGRHEGGSGG